jgi:hypothetical protein
MLRRVGYHRGSNENVVVVARSSFHASAVWTGDALDMVDTFERRHGTYILI